MGLVMQLMVKTGPRMNTRTNAEMDSDSDSVSGMSGETCIRVWGTSETLETLEISETLEPLEPLELLETLDTSKDMNTGKENAVVLEERNNWGKVVMGWAGGG